MSFQTLATAITATLICIPAFAGVIVSNNPGVTLTGTHTLNVEQFTGIGNSVFFDFGSGPVATGPLTFDLNPLGSSFYTVNFDMGETLEHYEVIISSPVLTSMGLAPELILNGRGVITDAFQLFPPFRTDVFLHDNLLTMSSFLGQPVTVTGLTVVESLQIPTLGAFGFSGFFSDYDPVFLAGSIVETGDISNNNGGRPSPAPEPSALLLLLTGLVLLGGMRRQTRSA